MSTVDDVLGVDLSEVSITVKKMFAHYMRTRIIEIVSKEMKHRGIGQICLCRFND